jgi:hypothetical protein
MLRQMIISLTTKDTDIPLFHCVDLDWKGEGYTFQYSPQVKTEAEYAVYTFTDVGVPLGLLEGLNVVEDKEVVQFFTVVSLIVDTCTSGDLSKLLGL